MTETQSFFGRWRDLQARAEERVRRYIIFESPARDCRAAAELADRLEAAGFARPASGEDWYDLAWTVGVPPGPTTKEEVTQTALAWMNRTRLEKRIEIAVRREAQAGQEHRLDADALASMALALIIPKRGNVAEIARFLGVKRARLYRLPEFMLQLEQYRRACQLEKQSRRGRRCGHDFASEEPPGRRRPLHRHDGDDQADE